MHSDSRKAQHNSFAHYRADFLFAKLPAAKSSDLRAPGRQNDRRPETVDALRTMVRAGLLGFVSAAQVAL
jgi:hypothetical protein